MKRTQPGEARKWVEAHVSYQGDDCLVWPFNISRQQGYGHIGYSWDGKKIGKLVHTFMCELAHGSAPDPMHEASHNCGNRACVNPQHLEWKTRSENQSDRRRHGTAATSSWGNRSPMTKEQWDQIRALKGKQTLEKTAAQFGVSIPTIHRIQKTTNDPVPVPPRMAERRRQRAQQS